MLVELNIILKDIYAQGTRFPGRARRGISHQKTQQERLVTRLFITVVYRTLAKTPLTFRLKTSDLGKKI